MHETINMEIVSGPCILIQYGNIWWNPLYSIEVDSNVLYQTSDKKWKRDYQISKRDHDKESLRQGLLVQH